MQQLSLEIRSARVDFERFRSVYFSEEFNLLAMKAAQLRERVLEHEEQLVDGRELRRVKMVPDVALPRAIASMVGSNVIAYREVSIFDPIARVAQLNIESLAGDAIKVGGQARFIEAGEGVTMRFEGSVKVSIFGLGGMIEKIIVKQVRDRYRAIEGVLQQYLDDTPPGSSSFPDGRAS